MSSDVGGHAVVFGEVLACAYVHSAVNLAAVGAYNLAVESLGQSHATACLAACRGSYNGQNPGACHQLRGLSRMPVTFCHSERRRKNLRSSLLKATENQLVSS